MGTDVTEDLEPLPYPSSFKVHHSMCSELMRLVDRVIKILPEIEAARPRCSSGIQALCLLNSAMERAKLLLQHCSEASKLYLAITGDVIVTRCKRSRNLLEQSLIQIQNMVPVMLAVEISQIVDDLRSATFTLDSSEEEAGKVVKELLQQNASASDSMECSESKALQFAASRLRITSPKAIVIEKRSIKRLLDKVSESDPRKKKILKYLLYLLTKHGNSIMREPTNTYAPYEGTTFENSNNDSVHNISVEVESRVGYEQNEPENDLLSRAIHLEEFKCPISMRMMYDPVVIASGQTFERMWIQKWFDEGNNTCPKTNVKLANLSLTPNTAMKDLISKWCMNYGVNIPDPNVQPDTDHSLEASSTSMASLGSSMNDFRFPVDISNVSLGSSDTSSGSENSHSKIAAAISVQADIDSRRCQPVATIKETDMESLTRLAELPWDSQCDLVKDMKNRFKCSNEAGQSISSEKYAEPVIEFLTAARDLHDPRAQRSGIHLLLEFVSTNRSGKQYLSEDTFCLLASFLDSEITEDALAIVEALSGNPFHRSKITGSGALASILKFLDSEIRDFQEQAIRILQNLSFTRDFCLCIDPSECIPKLVPFLTDSTLARHSIIIVKNMCDTEEARAVVAETKACLASIVELLEIGSREEQEHAAAILLSLCSQRVQYCEMVMDEGVIPALVNVSINGNEKGKVIALELLRLLRDCQHIDELESVQSDTDASEDNCDLPKGKKCPSKTSGFFGMKLSIFSKTKCIAPKKKK